QLVENRLYELQFAFDVVEGLDRVFDAGNARGKTVAVNDRLQRGQRLRDRRECILHRPGDGGGRESFGRVKDGKERFNELERFAQLSYRRIAILLRAIERREQHGVSVGSAEVEADLKFQNALDGLDDAEEIGDDQLEDIHQHAGNVGAEIETLSQILG